MKATKVADGHYVMGGYDLTRTAGGSWKVINRADCLNDRTIVPTLALAKAWVTGKDA